MSTPIPATPSEETTMTSIPRRSVTSAALWATPVLAVAAAAPVSATSGRTDLSVEVSDPPTDPDSGAFVDTVPIYRSNLTSVATRASISTSFTITNVGSVTATNPAGTVDLQFIDYSTDVAVGGSEARKFNLVPTTAGVTFSNLAGLDVAGAGNRYAYTYAGTLAPGASVTVTVKMWVQGPFAHASAMQMLLSASVIDETDGDWDDNSGRSGHIPSFGTI